MRKLHLDNEVVLYRIHSELLEVRRNGKKTLTKRDDVCNALGLDAWHFCCENQCEGKKAQITPSMVKRFVQMNG